MSSLPGLSGKVALVTGSASGIGAAITRLLSNHGVKVEGFDLPEHDLSKFSRIGAWVDEVADRHGRLDILVNNAGVTCLGNVIETSEADIDRVMGLNFKAPLLMMKAAIPHMIKAGGGSIINTASDQAFIGKRYSAVYGASKAAIAQLSRSAALDWAREGIRVNCIAPGSTDTPMLRQVIGDLASKYPGVYPVESEDFYKSSVPLGRFANPIEIAWAVAFLASDAASFMTGVILPVDGGFTAQ